MLQSLLLRRRVSSALAVVGFLGLGCSSLPPALSGLFGPREAPEPAPVAVLEAEPLHEDHEERHALDQDRIGSLEMEIDRLRADLAQAEATMLATDSDVRAARNRATAVSIMAEARIAVERAQEIVKWRPAELLEAQSKLVEAEKQLTGGHPPAAVYFASRGQRIAQSLINEAKLVEQSPETRFVRSGTLNLRAGPSIEDRVVRTLKHGTPVFEQRRRGDWARVRTLSGELGWVHGSLLQRRE